MKKALRQQRLTIREQEYRKIIIGYCWNHFKNGLTMEEMANIFRMPLAQYYKIIKKLKTNEEAKSKT